MGAVEVQYQILGERSLHKIVSQMGDPIKQRQLQFALVEVNLNKDLLESISVTNDEKFTVPFQYEWRPTKCNVYHCIRRKPHDCRVQKTKKVQVQKQQPQVQQSKEVVAEKQILIQSAHGDLDPDGFQRALKPIKVIVSQLNPTVTGNAF